LYGLSEDIIICQANERNGDLHFLNMFRLYNRVVRDTFCVPTDLRDFASALDVPQPTISEWHPIRFYQTLCIPENYSLRFKEFQISITGKRGAAELVNLFIEPRIKSLNSESLD
jgi:hypothetical protein